MESQQPKKEKEVYIPYSCITKSEPNDLTYNFDTTPE